MNFTACQIGYQLLRVRDLADFRGEGEEPNHLLPVAPPALRDRRIFCAQGSRLKILQPLPGHRRRIRASASSKCGEGRACETSLERDAMAGGGHGQSGHNLTTPKAPKDNENRSPTTCGRTMVSRTGGSRQGLLAGPSTSSGTKRRVTPVSDRRQEDLGPSMPSRQIAAQVAELITMGRQRNRLGKSLPADGA